MLIYILKFSACLTIFMVFYKLVLEKSTAHHFKRFYLLASLAIAFVIPSLTFVEYIEPITVDFQSVNSSVSFNNASIVSTETPIDYTNTILWSLYSLVTFIFLLKFCFNLNHIISRIKHNPKYKSERFINVLISNLITPHTFFNFIFLNKNQFEKGSIPKEVLLHEQTHAKQKHSIDVLILEFLQIFLWFNPLIYVLKRDIKLNHEFLADRAVLQHGIQPSAYQQLLLAFSSNANEPQLANAINYSSIKKRFTVMKTKTSTSSIWLRSLLLLPLLAILLYSFTDRKQVYKNNQNIAETFTTESVQQGATKTQIAEYNKLAKHCNSQIEKKGIIKHKDVVRLKQLYSLMNDIQRKNAEAFPDFSKLPPPPPPHPELVKTGFIEVKDQLLYYVEINKRTRYFNSKGFQVSKEGETISKSQVNASDVIPGNYITKVYAGNKIFAEFKDNNPSRKDDASDFPPPPPPASEVKEVEIESPMPPPPPIPENASPEEKARMKKVIDDYAKQHPESVSKMKLASGEVVDVVEIPEDIDKSATPPAPKSTLDFAIDLAKKNAKFYFDKKEISSDEAISMLKKNSDLNLLAKHTTSKQPLVYISIEPIHIKPQKSEEPVQVNGKTPINDQLSLTKKEVINLNLTFKNAKVTSFKFKIPGKPSQSISGNTLNENSKALLNTVSNDTNVQLFDIKDANNIKHPPIIINIVN